MQLAFCWSHVRGRFYELAAAGPAPIASETLERIGALYAVEKDIRGRNPDERRVEVDHSTLNRWVVRYGPMPDRQFRDRKRPVGSGWRMDETYMKVKGMWKYLYRAVDKAGATVDFLLTAKRDRKAALRFLRKAIGQHGIPEKVTIGKSGANTAAMESYNEEGDAKIEVRQNKYLNNIVEQDHRAIKRMARPMLGFKSFRSAAATLAGIELMHMIRKGQLRETTLDLSPAEMFYALAA